MESTGEQEKKINRLSNFLLLLALIILIFGSGYRFGQYRSQAVGLSETGANAITVTPSNVDLGLFWKVWNNLKIKYVDQSKVKQQDMIYGAIKGMVASIGDPYTYFLTPKENQSSKDDLGGLYEGIGAQLGMKEGIIIVVAPLKNSPAERAGIKAGDIILAINGESTKGMSLTTAVSKIRGQKNTDAKLKIFRDQKEEIELAIKREAIKVDSVELSYKKAADCQNNCPEVAYIKVSQFGDTSNSEWDIAVKQVAKLWQKKEIRGLVLDLRSNPGGYLESAVYLASEFLPAGKLVVRQEYADKSGKDYLSVRSGELQTIPLTILIDQGSASASEILSGALRDYQKGLLIGQKSFGKGSVQEAMDLSEGAGLHVTIAKWILPKGDWINGKGIEPKIKIENKVKEGNTITDETDLQLQRAISELAK